MTAGYLCNGPDCGAFITGQPDATYQHRVALRDDDDKVRFEIVEAHLCDECAIDVSRTLNLLPEPDGTGDDAEA